MHTNVFQKIVFVFFGRQLTNFIIFNLSNIHFTQRFRCNYSQSQAMGYINPYKYQGRSVVLIGSQADIQIDNKILSSLPLDPGTDVSSGLSEFVDEVVRDTFSSGSPNWSHVACVSSTIYVCDLNMDCWSIYVVSTNHH